LNDKLCQQRFSTETRRRQAPEAPPLGNGYSLWSATAPPSTNGSTAEGNLETDVAVVGGGVAGLSVALHLATLGVETLVLEAESPGSGATGVSGGILAPDFSRDGIAKAVGLHGRERGERLARMVGNSAAYTRELISRHEIDCDFQGPGFVSPGQTVRDIEALQSDGKVWNSLGFTVEYLDERQTADAIGTNAYRGALWFESGGALNPLAYAIGLAGAACAAGAQIFTYSPVIRIEKRDGKWRLDLPQGRVSANRVVLAANGGNAALHPSLLNVALPFLVYEYATPPLSESELTTYFGAGLPYTDRQAYVFSARFDGAGRLISAIPEVMPAWNTARFSREARRRLRDIYSLPLPSIEFAWQGIARLNASLLPAVYLPEGDMSMIAVQACNGRGLGVNTILGGEVANLMASGDPDSTSMPLSRPKGIPMHWLASGAPKVIMSLARAKDRFRRRQGSVTGASQ
jgi:glycine/D-amino acid oxidase-like deaminating enzyme